MTLELFIAIYFGIGAAIAFAFIYVLKNPPEYCKDVEMFWHVMSVRPWAMAFVVFSSCVLMWPYILLRKQT